MVLARGARVPVGGFTAITSPHSGVVLVFHLRGRDYSGGVGAWRLISDAYWPGYIIFCNLTLNVPECDSLIRSVGDEEYLVREGEGGSYSEVYSLVTQDSQLVV